MSPPPRMMQWAFWHRVPPPERNVATNVWKDLPAVNRLYQVILTESKIFRLPLDETFRSCQLPMAYTATTRDETVLPSGRRVASVWQCFESVAHGLHGHHEGRNGLALRPLRCQRLAVFRVSCPWPTRPPRGTKRSCHPAAALPASGSVSSQDRRWRNRARVRARPGGVARSVPVPGPQHRPFSACVAATGAWRAVPSLSGRAKRAGPRWPSPATATAPDEARSYMWPFPGVEGGIRRGPRRHVGAGRVAAPNPSVLPPATALTRAARAACAFAIHSGVRVVLCRRRSQGLPCAAL